MEVLVLSLAIGLVHPSGSIDRRTLLATAAGAKPLASLAAASELLPIRGKIAGGALPLGVGLGTCLVGDGVVPRTVALGIDAGYRVFDSAQKYGNEAGVGKALKQAIASGLVQREELFVTTKVWVDNMGYDNTLASVRESAAKLGVGPIDLVLIHWPGQFVARGKGDADRLNSLLRRDTWKALEALRKEGSVSQVGISNFSERHTRELLSFASTRPAVNQFEVHPYNTRSSLVALCQTEGITVNSYCPLGGKGNKGQVTDLLLKDAVIKQVAAAHDKTAAQVILRWHLQHGLTPIPKASSKAHIRENYDLYDFALSTDEMRKIDGLNRDQFALFDADVLA